MRNHFADWLRERVATTKIWPVAMAAILGVTAAGCAPKPTAPEVAGVKPRSAAEDDAHPGRQVYLQNCAACHDNPDQSNAPSLATIREFDRSRLKYALEYSVMLLQAQNVPQESLAQLVDWMPSGDEKNAGWIEAASCPTERKTVQLDNAPRTVTSLPLSNDGNRVQTAHQAGLFKDDLKNLEVAWVIAFPNNPNMRSQPVIVGDTLFIAAADIGRMFALDAKSGCVKWNYKSDFPLRSALAFAEATPGTPAAIIASDAAGFVHAVDAVSGAKLWVTDVKLHKYNRLTGAPVVHRNRVFVPVSINEATFANTDTYECCTSQGGVVALDMATGKKLWVGRTIDEDPRPTIKNRIGTQMHGPSGAMVWSTPIIDEKRNQLYVGTGENLSWPGTDTSDAIIAYHLDSGAKRWVFQGSKNDLFNIACLNGNANCEFPGTHQTTDLDFGATSMLIKRKDGSELVIAGQKSGALWALNPDNGKVVWSNRIGRGGLSGGIHWGMAFDGELIFAPINDPDFPGGNPNWGPGLHAVDSMTGEIAWSYKPNKRDCGQDLPAAVATRPALEQRMTPVMAPEEQAPPEPENAMELRRAQAGCRLGMSSLPLLVDGALVTGTMDGMLRIFDSKTGHVLFEYMTNREFASTVNKVPGKGGALDNAPYVAAGGTLFVQSGYGRGAGAGNVLIAFRPVQKQ